MQDNIKMLKSYARKTQESSMGLKFVKSNARKTQENLKREVGALSQSEAGLQNDQNQHGSHCPR